MTSPSSPAGDDVETNDVDANTATTSYTQSASCETSSLLSVSSTSTGSSTVMSRRRTSCSRRTGREATRPSSRTLEGPWVSDSPSSLDYLLFRRLACVRESVVAVPSAPRMISPDDPDGLPYLAQPSLPHSLVYAQSATCTSTPGAVCGGCFRDHFILFSVLQFFFSSAVFAVQLTNTHLQRPEKIDKEAVHSDTPPPR